MATTPHRKVINKGQGRAQGAPSSAAPLSASSRWLPQVLALAVIGYWLLVKSVLFHRLEYTSDLFTNLQLTRSFFEGRALLWENAFGNHKAFHNLYIAVLLYPLTRFLGAYGLFLTQALLSGWAVYSILARARDAAEWKRGLYWAAVVAMALGPVAFFIWDNPIYGFHFELLFVPLSVLFALSLSKRSKSAWIFAGLIALTREEGAIVGWCIHVLNEVLNAQAGVGDRQSGSALFRRLSWITLGWFLVFIAGMGLLLAMGSSHGRLGTAIPGVRGLLEDPATRSFLLASLMDAALLLAAGGIVYLAGIPPRGLLASLLISLVLIIPTTVASSTYGAGSRAHGIAWPPRFAMFWGVALAASLFAIERARPLAFATSRRRRATVAIAVAASVVAQVAALGARKQYDFISRVTLQAGYVSSALSSAEDAFLRCLGHDLPRDTSVTTTGGLFGRFHQQDLLWPDRVGNAWKPPEVVVCDDAGRIPWEYGCLKLARSMASSYATLQLGNLFVRYASRPKAVVEACAARTVLPANPAEQR